MKPVTTSVKKVTKRQGVIKNFDEPETHPSNTFLMYVRVTNLFCNMSLRDSTEVLDPRGGLVAPTRLVTYCA